MPIALLQEPQHIEAAHGCQQCTSDVRIPCTFKPEQPLSVGSLSTLRLLLSVLSGSIMMAAREASHHQKDLA